MSADDEIEQTDRESCPAPGTPEYQEHYERTGQAAMDATLAHPIVRVFFGFLTISLAYMWVEILREAVTEYSLVWGIVSVVAWTIILGYVIREVGSVAICGKSLSPWFVAMVRRSRLSKEE